MIFENEKLIDAHNLSVTDLGDIVTQRKNKMKEIQLGFSCIKTLKGEKNILEQAFQDTKKEMLNA
jgi:hypothetical protein